MSKSKRIKTKKNTKLRGGWCKIFKKYLGFKTDSHNVKNNSKKTNDDQINIDNITTDIKTDIVKNIIKDLKNNRNFFKHETPTQKLYSYIIRNNIKTKQEITDITDTLNDTYTGHDKIADVIYKKYLGIIIDYHTINLTKDLKKTNDILNNKNPVISSQSKKTEQGTRKISPSSNSNSSNFSLSSTSI